MKPEEIAFLSIIVSGIVSTLTMVVGKLLSRRVDRAGALSNEGDAAESLSNAAKIQVETYVNNIVTPLRTELSELKDELRRADDALDHLIRKTQHDHPEDVEIAIRIRRGQLNT